VRRDAIRRTDSTDRAKVLEWIEWAERQADRIDPSKPSPLSLVDDKERVIRRLQAAEGWWWTRNVPEEESGAEPPSHSQCTGDALDSPAFCPILTFSFDALLLIRSENWHLFPPARCRGARPRENHVENRRRKSSATYRRAYRCAYCQFRRLYRDAVHPNRALS
jgi:hypothetical protein